MLVESVKQKNFEVSEEVFNLAKERRIYSNQLYNAMLNYYAMTGKVKEAKIVFNQMKYPDPSSMVSYLKIVQPRSITTM